MNPNVNIIDFLDECIEKTNKINKGEGITKAYEIKIVRSKRSLNENQAINKKGGAKSNLVPCKTLVLYLHDLETNKRTALYENTAIFKDPRKGITGKYTINLYKDFVFQCLVFTLRNIEAIQEKEQAKKALEVAEKAAKNVIG